MSIGFCKSLNSPEIHEISLRPCIFCIRAVSIVFLVKSLISPCTVHRKSGRDSGRRGDGGGKARMAARHETRNPARNSPLYVHAAGGGVVSHGNSNLEE